MQPLLRTTSPPQATSLDARIARSMWPGAPVTTRRDLRAAGIDRRAIARRLADGRLVEIWTDTFLVGIQPADAPTEVLLAAAVATAGPDAALDGTTALHRRGLWERHDGSIHVVSPRAIRPVPAYAIRFHRSTSIVSDRVCGLPTRVPSESLFAAATHLSAHEIACVIARGQYTGAWSLDELHRLATTGSCVRGAPVVRQAVRLRRGGSVGTRSRSEESLRPHLTRTFGEPLVNVRGAAGIQDYEPDFCWPDHRWIVEVDGGHHEDSLVRDQDERRDALLSATGWTIVRVWWRDARHEPRATVARVAREFGVDASVAY